MKNRLLYIFFLLMSAVLYGQVTLLADTDKKEVAQNETLHLTIIFELNGPEYVQESTLKLPDLSKFNIIGRGSDQNTFLDPKTNVAINQIVYEIALSPKQSGRIKIGSVLVQVNGKMYKSEPFDIFVTEAVAERKPSPSDDMQLSLELQDREVYKNQPTIAVLRAYSKDFNNFRKLGKVKFPIQGNLKIRPVSFTRSEIEQEGGRSSQVIAVAMIFPQESGKITVNPATVAYNSDNRVKVLSTGRTYIHVKRLPAGSPENFQNAVGIYNVNMQLPAPDQRLEINKPVDVVVKISGEGNLNAAQLPKIASSEKFVLYRPQITETLANGKKGVTGTVEAKYLLIPKVAGTINVETENFSYFNPETKEYVEVGSKSGALNIMTPEEIADSKSALEKVNEYTNNVLETVDTPILKTGKLKVKTQNDEIRWRTLLSNYSLIIAFVVMLAMLYTFFKKMTGGSAPAETAPITTVAETEEKLRKTLFNTDQPDFDHLARLTENENFSEFFNELEKSVKYFENKVKRDYDKNLLQYITDRKGAKEAESLRSLLQRVNMEKYAPFHTRQQVLEILHHFRILLGDIV